jgi:hypothetical protein
MDFSEILVAMNTMNTQHQVDSSPPPHPQKLVIKLLREEH